MEKHLFLVFDLSHTLDYPDLDYPSHENNVIYGYIAVH